MKTDKRCAASGTALQVDFAPSALKREDLFFFFLENTLSFGEKYLFFITAPRVFLSFQRAP